jgi:hypothetical protein
VNVQPDPVSLALEVHVGRDREAAGVALDAPFFHDDMLAATRELAAQVDAGAFVLDEQGNLPLAFVYETPDDWQGFLDRPRAGGLAADQRRLDRAVHAMATGAGAIVATVSHTVRSYRRA